MPVADELRYLLEKQLAGQLTAAERSRLIYLLRQPKNRLLLEDNIEDILHQHRYHDTTNLDKQALFDEVMREAINIEAAPEAKVVPLYTKWRTWLPYAAAIVVVLLISTWYFTKTTTEKQNSVASNPTPVNDSLKTANKVMLTLADGTQIAVDEVRDGDINNALGAHIRKQPGVIVFNPSTAVSANTKDVYNTITTTRGKQYHIILPDKTEVWLNAASSLKFPLAFTGKERKVILTGEGYFEVASLPLSLPTGREGKKPFIVMANGTQVRVLGTHFNVMAYANEGAVRTTLLEGSVKVVKYEIPTSRDGKANPDKSGQAGKENSVLLKPGEQAIALANSPTTNHSPLTIDHSPNLEQIMAWKNGEFRFENSSIETIMRQVERWYDLDVEYKGIIPADLALSGVIAQREKVTQLLDILEATHRVRFSMEGNKVIVMPYQTK